MREQMIHWDFLEREGGLCNHLTAYVTEFPFIIYAKKAFY